MLVLLCSNIWIACGLHSVWNFVLYGIMGLSVSGSESKLDGLMLFCVEETNILNGAEYGIEASIITTLVLGVLLFVLDKSWKGRMGKMEFNNKLYNLRKQKGLSQEELANRLNVSRQTVSKWEVGDSTPDMEKLIAISDLFEISLDELVMDKVPAHVGETSANSEIVNELKQKVLTDKNKQRAKRGLKIVAIILGIIVLIDVISMIAYFGLYGFPQ